MQSLIMYALVGIGVWLLVLSFLIGWITFFFRALSRKVGVGDLISILKKVLEQEAVNHHKDGQGDDDGLDKV